MLKETKVAAFLIIYILCGVTEHTIFMRRILITENWRHGINKKANARKYNVDTYVYHKY